MKNKILIYVIVFVGVFTSCTKDSELNLEVNKTQKISQNSMSDIEYSVDNGIILFKSSEDFYSLSEEISKMTNDEVLQWEEANSFVSLNSEVENVFEMLDSCKTYEEYENILDMNKDIVKIEDKAEVAVLESYFYPRIINREGFFIVGRTLHKVTNEGVFISEDGCFDAINSAAIKGKDNDDTNIIFISHQADETTLKSGSCGSSASGASDWNNDRRCRAGIYVEKIVNANSGWYYYEYHVTVYSKAIGINIWGNEKLYNSAHYLDESEYSISVPSGVTGTTIHYQTSSFYDSPQGPTSDMKIKYWQYDTRIGSQIITNSPAYFMDPSFVSVTGEFHTRGSSPETAEYSCN